jgi:hypothetical protein
MSDSHTLTPSPAALAVAMDVRISGWPPARSLRPQSRGISQ